MKERILAFLQSENKSYAQFAEEIGVQPSGISHILSGRNNPSLDFVIKMLQKYTSLSSEWLLFGTGTMYKSISQPTLFDNDLFANARNSGSVGQINHEIPDEIPVPEINEMIAAENETGSVSEGKRPRRLSHVIMFYSDKTFTEYRPG